MPQHQSRLYLSALSVIVVAVALLASSASDAAKRTFKNDQAAADSFQTKIDFIKANAASSKPSQKPTVFSQEEINAYFAERRLNMPEGVKSVVFDLRENEVTARTRVDFEQIRKSRQSMNPLLAIFDGEHDCEVTAYAEPAGAGMVHVRVESVEIDGVTVPKMALRMFVEKYVNPKYPNVGLDNDYRLPAHIESAVIDLDEGTIIQR
jgi:hypothetical protein